MTRKLYVNFVNVNELKPAPFNPPVRTSDRAVKDLVRSISENGFWNHKPITITEDGYIADGHRRWTVAKSLGITHIPALVTHQELHEAWSSSMESTRPLNGKEIIAAKVLGLNSMPRNSVGKNLQYYSNKYGEDVIKYLYENGKTLVPIQQAERVSRYIGWDGENIFSVVKWIVENKMGGVLQSLFEQNFPKDVLRWKIENNESIKFEER